MEAVHTEQRQHVDRDLALRGRTGALIYGVTSLGIAMGTGQFTSQPWPTSLLVTSIIIIGLCRFRLASIAMSTEAIDPRWRLHFGTMVIASAGFWGMFSSTMAADGFGSIPSILSIVATSAFALGGGIAMAPSLPMARGFCAAILIPQGVFLMAQGGTGSISMGLMLFIYFGYCSSQAKEFHREYWDLLKANTALKGQAEELSLTNAELREARIAAEKATRTKSDFLATMSHEIRTPMNGVIGMADLLLDTQLDANQKDFAETIRLSGEQLTSLINDILDFSKIEAGRLELEQVPVNIRTTVDEALDMLGPTALRKNIELVHVPGPGLPAQVLADPSRLRQVLLNLVGNSIKFTSSGGVVVRTRWDQADGICIDVEDSGVGMKPEVLEKIFEPFSQADSSTTRQFGGTGLGLAIVKCICQAMNGTIEVSSTLDQGSVFSVHLPLPIKEEYQPQAESPRNFRVVAISDFKPNTEAMEAALVPQGMWVESATRWDDAYRLLERPVDLLLVDANVSQGLAEVNLTPSSVIVVGSCAGCRGPKTLACSRRNHVRKPMRSEFLVNTAQRALGLEVAGEPTRKEKAPATLEAGLSLHLLVAEDNLVNQKVVSKALETLGCSCDLAGNGLEALAALENKEYHAVLMDCQMPVMDGFEATKVIRNSSRGFRDIPIYALTANALAGDRERCLEAGMDDYLTKPLNRDHLKSALEQIPVTANI